MATSQEEFRQASIVDQDSDGQGEFGSLQELAGTVNTRGGIHPASPAFVSRVFGTSAATTGIAEKSGYLFVVYLPTLVGSVRELPVGSVEVSKADANAQELRYVIYAWPVKYGGDTTRVFAINQQGEVYASSNKIQQYSGRDNIPGPNAALDITGGGDVTLNAPLGGKKGTTGDGQTWTVAGG